MKKFNILTNPPYTDNIHLDILKEICVRGFVDNYLIILQPPNYLIDEKNINSRIIETKKVVKDMLESVILFNGNVEFGITSFLPLAIVVFNNNKGDNRIKVIDEMNNTTYYYNDIEELNKFGNIPEYYSLKNKFLKLAKKKNLWDVHKEQKNILKTTQLIPNAWVVTFTGIRGNVNTNDIKSNILVADDFYTIIGNHIKVQKSDNIQIDDLNDLFWFFDTEKQAEHFIIYLKQKHSRFAGAIYKMNSQWARGELEIVPYLDFNKTWTDDELKELYQTTIKEWDFIENVIPDYYKEEKNV